MENGHGIDVEKLWSELQETDTVINMFRALLFSEKQLRFIKILVY